VFEPSSDVLVAVLSHAGKTALTSTTNRNVFIA